MNYLPETVPPYLHGHKEGKCVQRIVVGFPPFASNTHISLTVLTLVMCSGYIENWNKASHQLQQQLCKHYKAGSAYLCHSCLSQENSRFWGLVGRPSGRNSTKRLDGTLGQMWPIPDQYEPGHPAFQCNWRSLLFCDYCCLFRRTDKYQSKKWIVDYWRSTCFPHQLEGGWGAAVI